MLFSIVVPVYKVEKYLPACLESILSQDFTDYEVILVNDGSPDGSLDICKDAAAKDSRVRVLDRPHAGLVATRKAGAREAKGEYIMAVDSDDLIEKGLLSFLASVIEKHHPSLVTFDYIRFSGDKRKECLSHLQEGMYEGEACRDIAANSIYDSHGSGMRVGILPQMVWGKAVKADLYRAAQETVPEDIGNGEDLLFTAALMCRVQDMYLSHFMGYLYRMTENSMTHTRTDENFNNYVKVHNYLAEMSEKEPMLKNQCAVRSVAGFWHFAMLMADKRSLGEFRALMQKSCSPLFLTQFREAKIGNPSKSDALKQKWLAGQKWLLIWLYRKVTGRN